MSPRLRRHRAPALMVLLYLILVATGTTTSSLGNHLLRQDPRQPHGITLGQPRDVRSDEWLSGTPIQLGILASGDSESQTPLAVSDDLLLNAGDGVVGLLLFPDGRLLRLGPFLPDAQTFAALWWLGVLALFLCLPPLLCRLGARPLLAWLATLLVFLAPASAWWSMAPVRILGWTAAACLLCVWSFDAGRAGAWLRALLLAVGAGILYVRLPTNYVPWSLTIGVPLVLATWAFLLWRRTDRRPAVLAVVVSGLVGAVLYVLLLLENSAAIRSQLGTVYPGARRVEAGGVPLDLVFGAPHLGILQTAPLLRDYNFSEISSGYSFFVVWSAVLVVTAVVQRRRVRLNPAVVVLGGATLVWTIWCLAPLGPLSQQVPVLNLVAPSRAAQTLGFPALLLTVLLLSSFRDRTPRVTSLVAAAGCGGVTLAAGLLLRPTIPSLSLLLVLVTSVFVAVVVFTVGHLPHERWPAMLAVFGAVATVIVVNPIQIGLGDLRGTPTADALLARGEVARTAGDYWASDNEFTDALLLATGVPSLSGHQTMGPDRAAWQQLDPQERYEQQWNRGASYVQFRWTDDQTPVVTNPGFDRVLVSVDPCRLPSLGLRLRYVMSFEPLTMDCLRSAGSVQWMGRTDLIYRVTTPS